MIAEPKNDIRYQLSFIYKLLINHIERRNKTMAQKKSFKADINPALQFISTPTPAEKEAIPTSASAPEGYKLNHLYIETKSKRLQLLIQPSLHEKLRAKATSEMRSVNDLVHSILEEAFEGE